MVRYGTIVPVHPFLVSAAVVAVAEFGDKTQLLALVLAARFRRPGLILLGILCATVVNHLIAGALGAWIASQVRPSILRLIVAAAFLGMAVWTLIPDRHEERDEPVRPRFGVFGTTLIAFFLAEMGDKTQIATAALAARYQTLLPVVAGSALGMLAMDALAILLGEVAAQRLPLKLIRAIAAAIFLLLAVVVLVGAGS
jgi:putative Ca2+/H+ antiporter (TMEM165/GDT1 family)